MPNEDNETPVINQPDSTLETPVINQPDATPEQPVNLTEQFQREHPVGQTPPKKKSKAGAIIGIIITLLIIAGLVAAAIIFIPKLFNKSSSDLAESEKIEPAEEKYSAYEKIALEYQNGGIDIAEYFKQLVYLETDSSKVDEIYKSDYENDSAEFSKYNEILEIVNKHYDKLDKNIVKQFFSDFLQSNYRYGEESTETANANNIQLAAEESRHSEIHYFTKVKQSKNKNFLIWYTTEGRDKISDDQANEIADTLENTISSYNSYFNINYRFGRMIRTADISRSSEANKLLKKNGIEKNAWKDAMNVYVYDTESESAVASWRSIGTITDDLLIRIVADSHLEDQYLAFPYMVFNQSLIGNTTQINQVSNHELFHHYQYLYCYDQKNEDCASDGYINSFYFKEMTANFASSAFSRAGKDGILTTWSKRLNEQSEKGLMAIRKPGYGTASTGYGAYPYLISYIKEAGGKVQDIVSSHTQHDPLSYLGSKLSSEQLHTAIAKLAYYIISNDYPDGFKAAATDETVLPNLYKYEVKGFNTYTLKPGAIKFYQLDKGAVIYAESDDELATYVMFGDNGKEVWRSDKSNIQIDSNDCFKDNKTCYLAYANASLSKDITIKAEVRNLGEEKKFITSYKNYNLDITMSLTIKGITVTSKAVGVMDELHQREHLNATSTTMGVDVKNEIYTDSYKGVSYTSAPDMGFGDIGGLIGDDNLIGWTKDDDVNYYINLGSFLKTLEKGGDGVTKVDDTHYHMKINAKNIQGLISSNGNSASNIQMPDRDIEANITVANGYITEIDYDFGDIAGIENFKADIKFSNYDEAGSVYIPLTIIRDAKEH